MTSKVMPPIPPKHYAQNVGIRMSRAMQDAVDDAAAKEQVSRAEFVRRAIQSRLFCVNGDVVDEDEEPGLRTVAYVRGVLSKPMHIVKH